MIEKIKNTFKLIRWFHELLAVFPFIALYFVLEYFIQKSGQPCNLSGTNFCILCICVQLLIAAGCILNDIMDRDIDKINKPNTRIIDRKIPLAKAKQLFMLTTFLILVLSVYISHYMFEEWSIICPVVYILSILYDVYFKKSPLIGNILIAGLASFIPLVLYFFAKECIENLNNEKLNVLIYLYCCFPFMIIVPRELSLDISDIEGDKAVGCRTLPIVIGVKKSKIIVIILILAIIVSSLFLMFQYHYLLFVCILIDTLLIYYLINLNNAVSRIDYIRAGRFLWFIFIVGLIGLTAATIFV